MRRTSWTRWHLRQQEREDAKVRVARDLFIARQERDDARLARALSRDGEARQTSLTRWHRRQQERVPK